MVCDLDARLLGQVESDYNKMVPRVTPNYSKIFIVSFLFFLVLVKDRKECVRIKAVPSFTYYQAKCNLTHNLACNRAKSSGYHS